MDPLVYLECLRISAERLDLAPSELRPVMLNEIMSVEDELGVELPEQYEDFLMKAGVGKEYGGLAFWYHLDLSLDGNLIKANQELHSGKAPQFNQKTPKSFWAVYDPCDGSLFGFERENGTFKPQLVVWEPDSEDLEIASSDFNSFLADNIECSIEEVEEAERRLNGD